MAVLLILGKLWWLPIVAIGGSHWILDFIKSRYAPWGNIADQSLHLAVILLMTWLVSRR